LLVERADGLDLNDLPLLGLIPVIAEDDGTIFGHALLGNDGTLTTAHDKVATDVFRTLAEIHGMDVLLVLEKAEATADHYWNLAEMDIWKEALMRGLAAVLVVSACDIDADIHCERGGVGEIAEPGVIGEHRENCAVVLKDGRFPELRLLKLNLDLELVADGRAYGCGQTSSRSIRSWYIHLFFLGLDLDLSHESIRSRCR
jgi:hypothetical protein